MGIFRTVMAVKPKRKRKVKVRNPVAKNLHKVHRHSVERDRTKYTRKNKHPNQEE